MVGGEGGGLREWPLTENGGFQSGHSQEKWDFGAKSNRKCIFFKNERRFDLTRSEK